MNILVRATSAASNHRYSNSTDSERRIKNLKKDPLPRESEVLHAEPAEIAVDAQPVRLEMDFEIFLRVGVITSAGNCCIISSGDTLQLNRVLERLMVQPRVVCVDKPEYDHYCEAHGSE